ncbi:MAG: hypothetical protein V5A22_09315 [Salinivenus sp.]
MTLASTVLLTNQIQRLADFYETLLQNAPTWWSFTRRRRRRRRPDRRNVAAPRTETFMRKARYEG